MKTLLYCGILFSCTTTIHAQNTKQNKTNFIQILTDDQGWGDLGSYGHQFLKTPNIDQLAEDGVKFSNCYAADAVCSPSRSAIITGRTPYRNRVWRWIPAKSKIHLPKDEVTLPQLLRKKGYQTAHFGKWHLSYYSEERIEGTFDYKDFGYGGQSQPTMNEYGYDYWVATGNVARPDHMNPKNFFINGEAMGPLEGFAGKLVADQVTKWFDEVFDQDKPFFLTVWFHEPHGPVNSDPRLVNQYDKIKDPSFQQYLANITQIDEAVGQIVQELKKRGIFDDTMIIYTSDNGPEGRHEYGSFNKDDKVYGGSRYRGSTGGLRGRKRHTHEGGIRVPGIISWPNGIKDSKVLPGTITDVPFVGYDIFPTILEIADIEVPKDRTIDGTSIMPFFKGKPIKRERPMYWRNNYYDMRIAIRQGEWKLLSNEDKTMFELYNLRIDPRETTNLKDKEPKRFESMKKALIAYDEDVMTNGYKW
ncbi:N-acetylgalactosamine-6-sulfatase [Puteibacter caeruleilacunae]|nr:N-acetylgalactosamine-6-sulfatase [Puteibacter caeruleilacunae]